MDETSQDNPVTTDLASGLVVIGASAGGIDAVLRVVASLPANLPIPVIVAQHLDPQRTSRLGDLLASRSNLPISTVTGRERLQPGTVYVAPADRDVEVTDHHIDLCEGSARSQPSIDRLMTTAARAYGDALICIILTGTGHDGAAGAQAVKAYGGTVIVQNPDTAEFAGMPASVPHSVVDIVAELDAIGALVVDLSRGDYLLPSPEEGELEAFLTRVRQQVGLDFGSYKRPTIERRLRRRMLATGTTSLRDYSRHIERHPDEMQRLVASFLIKVTRFFRDPEFFAYLRDEVLPSLIEDGRERGELRI